MNPKRLLPAALCGAVLWAGASLPASAAKPAKPEPLQGVVTQVMDGDTLRFNVSGQPAIELRLAQIDAPEICQAWGPQARDALKARVAGREVSVQTTGRDGYGRTLARIQVDGQNLGAWLVAHGHAWSQRNRWQQGPLTAQESQARAARRGLHAQPGALLPKAFRRSHGPCERARAH